MSLFKKDIIQILDRLSSEDCEGALPYLLLTSTSENTVQGLLAFRVQELFQEKNYKRYVVAREWCDTDIAVLTPLREKANQFKDPKAIIEIKMVAAPGKNATAVIKPILSLARQLKSRKTKWPNAECFGLLVVRNFRETSLNSTSEFDGVIKHRKKGLKSSPDLYRTVVMNRIKALCPSWVKQGSLMCGKEKVLRATVNLRWWLFSLR